MQNAKIAFFSSLETMTAAGLPPSRTLRMVPPRKLRRVCERMAAALDNGLTLAQAMSNERCFTRLETALVQVGEATGTLDRSARVLREDIEQRKQFKAKILSASLQTILTYIVAGPLLKIVDLATASFTCGGCSPSFCGWLPSIALHCLLWWGVPLLLFILCKLFMPTILGASIIGVFIDALPFIGKLQYCLNTAGFWRVFATCNEAGLPYAASIRLAADTCRNGLYARKYRKMADAVEQHGVGVAEAYNQIAGRRDAALQFPSVIASGEFSGHLPEAAYQISTVAANDAQTLLTRLSVLIPLAFYILLVLYLAYRIISFYAGYVSQILSF